MSIEPDNNNTSSIDVAISVATPDLAIAQSISSMLERRGLKVYFFIDSPEQTLGLKLKESLKEIYSSATLVLAICSHSYKTKSTEIELNAALRGAAAENGLIAVRSDDSAVPPELQDRVYWDLSQGYSELVNLVLRRFNIRPLSNPFLLLSATVCTTGLYWLFLSGLGFSDFRRWPDQLFLIAGLLPIIWVFLFRWVPILVNRARLKNQPAQISKQGVLEKRLDSASTYLAWLFGLAVLISLAFAYKTTLDIRKQAENLNTLARDMGQFFDEYYRDFTTVTGLATRASFATDPDSSADILDEYESGNRQFLSTGAKLRNRLAGAELFSSNDLADDFISATDLLERTSNVNIKYQITELARPDSSFGSAALQLRNRTIKKSALASYNQFFTETMLNAQDNYRLLQAQLAAERQNLTSEWQDILD